MRDLLARQVAVSILDDFSTGLPANLDGLDVRLIRGSITDASCVSDAASDCDAIVHLAARGSVPRSVADPVATHKVNATGTVNLLEEARTRGCQLVFASSSSVYGLNPQLPKNEESWTRPLSPYGASKLAAEGYVLGYRASYELPLQALRFFNVFGPWQRPDHDYAAVIPRWIWRIQHGLPIEIHGDGSQTRDFTYVQSVVDVLVACLAERVSVDSPINVAFGHRRSLLDLLAVIEAAVGRTAQVQFVSSRRGDVRDSENDPTLLKTMFPTVRPIAFEQAVQITAEWLAANYHELP